MKLLPGDIEILGIEESAMENTFIVQLESQELFVYSRGDFLLVGDLYDAARQVHVGEERTAARMAEAVASVSPDQMVVMGPDTGRYVTVFTDTDCVYCQQFHKTVPELQERGLQVRYLMFPRTGIGSPSYHEAVAVWCSEDQGQAMTVAKSGGVVESTECENPVESQYFLGRKIGVRGTPTLVLDNGQVIPGFLTPDELLAEAEMAGN
ncbi:MAG: DsbC family protein [Gammaproteobacteria bacterium]|nr:DsbC family protein [Gammaproteobacteria bacterium]